MGNTPWANQEPKCCILVALLALLTVPAFANPVQNSPRAEADKGACTTNGQIPAPKQHQNDACGAVMDHPPSHNRESCPDYGELQQQLHAQQLLLNVLSNVTAKVISAQAALGLLKDVAVLRTSLAHGAAAERWAKLKARSTGAKTGRQNHPVQQAKSTKHQNQQSPRELDKGDTTEPASDDYARSKGILIVAGGPNQLLNAHVLLQLLHHPSVGCMLPVEVVYYGAHEYDDKVVGLIQSHAKATGIAVTFLDGYQAAPSKLEPHTPITRITGFKTKVHALAFVTSFDEVLMLDSDNTPLADPSYLFNSASFRTMGNVQWLDFWRNQWMKPVLYNILGLDVPWEVNPRFRASEAGQLMIDRVRHYDVLEWLWMLNSHSSSGVAGSDPGIVGACMWGDKDTYPIAFHLAGKGHLINNIQHYPMQALSKPGIEYMHAGMVQRGLHGELLFLHRTAAGKLWPHCVARSMLTCQVWGFTSPVDQAQLVASVRDVTAMQYEPHKVDLTWQEQHCGSSLQQPISSTLMPCDLSKGDGLLPIPVIAAKRLPQQVQQMLDVTYDTFVQSVRQMKAPPTAAAAKQQQQQSIDPYYDPADPYE